MSAPLHISTTMGRALTLMQAHTMPTNRKRIYRTCENPFRMRDMANAILTLSFMVQPKNYLKTQNYHTTSFHCGQVKASRFQEKTALSMTRSFLSMNLQFIYRCAVSSFRPHTARRHPRLPLRHCRLCTGQRYDGRRRQWQRYPASGRHHTGHPHCVL